jgi:hypothetical protein
MILRAEFEPPFCFTVRRRISSNWNRPAQKVGLQREAQ